MIICRDDILRNIHTRFDIMPWSMFAQVPEFALEGLYLPVFIIPRGKLAKMIMILVRYLWWNVGNTICISRAASLWLKNVGKQTVWIAKGYGITHIHDSIAISYTYILWKKNHTQEKRENKIIYFRLFECCQGPLLLSEPEPEPIPARGCNQIHYKVRDEITYPFSNFNGATIASCFVLIMYCWVYPYHLRWIHGYRGNRNTQVGVKKRW